MKIGFFGDSFCADIKSSDLSYQTYIQKLATEYNAEIIHTGVPGSSVGDVLMMQINEVEQLPELCIFVWTDASRLFNWHIRNINSATAEQYKNVGKVWAAAADYYKYLCEDPFIVIQYRALLEYIDNHVLPTFPETTKIIHLWAFGEPNKKFIHKWKHGVEIRPALVDLCVGDRDFAKMAKMKFANHIDTQSKNELLFEWINEAIKNYSNGLLLTKELNSEQQY